MSIHSLNKNKRKNKNNNRKGVGLAGNSSTKKNKKSSIEKMSRRDNEGIPAHKAFLLWCMQNPTRRNISAVSRAVKKSVSTIREYRLRWEWDERSTAITAESEAISMYRQLYFDTHGTSEIDCVRKNITATISVTGTAPRNVVEAVEKSIKKPEKETVFDQEMKRKHLMLIDAAIGYIAQGIKDGDIKRTLRDLPTLINLRKEITDVGSSSNSRLVAESIRVRDAKANNGDIVEAMYEDAVELTAILGALKSRGKVVHPEQEQEA